MSCSLRAVWILSGDGRVLLSRRFPIAEKRARRANDALTPVPTDDRFSSLFSTHVLRSQRETETSSRFPIVALPTGTRDEDPLWPLVIVYRRGLYFVTLPVVDGHRELVRRFRRVPSVRLPCVTASFCALRALAAATVSYDRDDLDAAVSSSGDARTSRRLSPSRVADVHRLLAATMPFGKPLRTDARAAISSSPPHDSTTSRQKRPSWKPVPSRTNDSTGTLHLCVREEIRAVQYGREDDSVEDFVDVSGTITCRADVGGVPTVSVPLKNVDRAEYVYVHECARAPASPSETKKVTCTPPLGRFTLCKYRVDSSPRRSLPIRARFRSRVLDRRHAKIMLQMKFLSTIFSQCRVEHCEVRVPSARRGLCVASHTLEASVGTVSLTDDDTFVWVPGPGMFSPGVEAVLSGSVRFRVRDDATDSPLTSNRSWDIPNRVRPSEWLMSSIEDAADESQASARRESLGPDPDLSSGRTEDRDRGANDPFCTDLNRYAQIFFKLSGATSSGLNVDVDGVSMRPTPSEPLEIKLTREIFGLDYIVWNSLGDSRYIRPFPVV